MRTPVFTGSCPALATPFDQNGTINYDAFGRLIDAQIEAGVDAVCVCGTTGESATMSHEEDDAVCRYTVDRVAGRVPVIAGTGSNCTAKAVAMPQYACSVGADACLLVTPYYNKATQAGLIAHYTAIADASDKPLILYNVPSRTGCNLLPATCAALADHPRIAAVKEASGNIGQIQEIIDRRREGFLVLSGDDGIAVDVMRRGGDGVISVAVNAFPRRFMACIDLAKRGDFDAAETAFAPMHEVVEALFAEGNPTGVKCALSILGLIGNRLRLPLVAGTPALEARLRELIRTYDLR